MTEREQAAALIAGLESSAVRVETTCSPTSRMVWRRWGRGKPLVMLHGGAGSWMHWVRNIEELSRDRTLWLPDMPGFGDSDMPDENLDADTIAPYVVGGLSELLGGASFDLVGFSFGGLVAALIASQSVPVQRLVLVSVAAMGLASEPPRFKSLRGVADPAERKKVQQFNLNALMLNRAESADDLAIMVHERSTQRERAKNRKLVQTDILFDLAPKWQCPAYGIWARQDFLYRAQIDKLLEGAERLNLDDSTVIDHSGHWVQYENSLEFDRVLRRFLTAPV